MSRCLTNVAIGCAWLTLLAPVAVCDADTSDGEPGSIVTGPVRTVFDGLDRAVRRTDPCGTDLVCGGDPALAGANLPELRRARIGSWRPADVATDVFAGDYHATGQFLRVELIFEGLIHPPGPLVGSYEPRRYGQSPLLGYAEFDVDTNGNSGGNVDGPLVRYNGAVARFGGRPQDRVFDSRLSLDGRDPDDLFDTPPWIDRSGGDFELEFRGDEVISIHHRLGDSDQLFEEGEIWDIEGRFFRRAQGYDECAGGPYVPVVTLRFAHRVSSTATGDVTVLDGQTTVTFVYPLTNQAYADAHGEPLEPMNPFAFDANSIREALHVLPGAASSGACAGYEFAGLVEPWADQDPRDYLEPQRWRPTMLFGTGRSTVLAGEGDYVWSDVNPNVVQGDFNGDGYKTRTDARLAAEYVDRADGDPGIDADATTNGVIEIVNFGLWFSLFDVNYDGFVETYDLDFSRQSPGDFDNDGDVDLKDLSGFQLCFGASAAVGTHPPFVVCIDAFDADGDERITLIDLEAIVSVVTGP